jgi:hypothetical protein
MQLLMSEWRQVRLQGPLRRPYIARKEVLIFERESGRCSIDLRIT